MKIPPRESRDPDLRREREIEAMDAEQGNTWRSSHAPGTFSCHELLDPVALIANDLDDWVVSHPSCLLDAEWSTTASSALDTLWNLYHNIGDAHLNGEDRPEFGDRGSEGKPS